MRFSNYLLVVLAIPFINLSCELESEPLFDTVIVTKTYHMHTEYQKLEEVWVGPGDVFEDQYIPYESEEIVEYTYYLDSNLNDTVYLHGILYGKGQLIATKPFEGDTLDFEHRLFPFGVTEPETIKGIAWVDGDSLHLDYRWIRDNWAPAPDRDAYIRSRGVQID